MTTSSPRDQLIAGTAGPAGAVGACRQAIVKAHAQTQEKRNGHAIRDGHGPRADPHDQRRQDAERHGPRGLGASQCAGARRCGDDVVQRDPREIGSVEQRGHDRRSLHAERRPRRDQGWHSQTRSQRRERGDEERAGHTSCDDEPQRRADGKGRRQAGADLKRRGNDIGANENEKQVERGLGLPSRRNG
jgi:hypothetical protein